MTTVQLLHTTYSPQFKSRQGGVGLQGFCKRTCPISANVIFPYNHPPHISELDILTTTVHLNRVTPCRKPANSPQIESRQGGVGLQGFRKRTRPVSANVIITNGHPPRISTQSARNDNNSALKPREAHSQPTAD
jgi:hypothetical protein